MGGGQGGRKRIASHGVHRVSRRRHKTGELRRWPWNVLSNLPYSTCVRAVDMCVICERFKRKPCAGTIVCLPIWSSSRCVSASSQHTYVCTPPAEPGGASGGLFARMHKPQTHVQGTMFVGAVPWLSAGLHDAGGFRAHCSQVPHRRTSVPADHARRSRTPPISAWRSTSPMLAQSRVECRDTEIHRVSM